MSGIHGAATPILTPVPRFIPVLLLLAASTLHASVDTIRQNFIDYYTAAGADRSAPMMANALTDLENQTRQITAPGFLLADGSWSDINYKDTPSGSWSPWDHTRRLITMAKAYRTPGQAFYNDEHLRQQIESALAYVPNYYGVLTLPTGNWWFWTIGVPIDLGPTLVLMNGAVSQNVIDACVTTMQFHIGNSPTAKGLVGPVPVGENLVWSGFTHLALGLMKNDPTMLAAVRDAMASACMPTTGDGIQVDSSFHQHGAQLYTGGYGASFANNLAEYVLITRSSEFALPDTALSTFTNYVADGIAWALYGNYFDASASGRYVARISTSGFDGAAALVQLAQVDTPRRAEINAAATAMMQSWPWGFPPELAGCATLVQQARAPSVWPAGHRHYPTSDYTVHRRPGWFASIKMFSSRTKSGESTNNENLLGSRQSDGRLYLSLDGNEYWGSDVWPSLDWSRLPGITVELKANAASADYGIGTKSFVGGTGDGMNGVSAMDLAPIDSALTAKKSWFFFDDSIVFLTNSITALSGNPVETVINQWPLRDANAPLTQSGNWLVCDNIGYYIYPQSLGNLNVSRATRSGTWAALGGTTDTTPRSATFLTLTLQHGIAPVGASAAYAIVPNATAQTMAQWMPPAVITNTSNASAVTSRNATGIVFWTAGANAAGFSADVPSIVYATTDGLTMDVWAADPTNASGTMHITVPGRYAADVPYTSDAHSTTLLLVRNAGRTVHAHLTPPPRHRASRH